MGGFFGSIQVRSENREAVVAAVEKIFNQKRIKCLVGPALNGWVGVFPEGSGQDEKVGAAIAAELRGYVLALTVHDSDIMTFWLWRDRKVVATYWSAPGYFGEEDRAKQEAMTGNAKEFEGLVPSIDELANILRREGGLYVFEEERLEQFAKLLGIEHAMLSYEYVKFGRARDIKGLGEFTEHPQARVASEKKGAAQEKKQIENNIRELKEKGLLLLRDERKDVVMRTCAVGNGFVVAWPDHMGALAVDFYRPPWDGPIASGLDLPPHLNAVVSDVTGTRVAMALGQTIRVWNIVDGTWNFLLNIAEPAGTIGLAISNDGEVVAHSSGNEIVITRIADQKQLFRLPGVRSESMSFHPSGEWIALGGDKFGIISLGTEPSWRELWVGSNPKPLDQTVTAEEVPKIDLRAKQQEIETKLGETIRKMQEAAQAQGGKLRADQMAEIQEGVKKALAKFKVDITSLRASDDASSPTASPVSGPPSPERVACVGFSHDGNLIWYGTNVGLRVCKWESVPRTTGSPLPAPALKYESSPKDLGDYSGYVYAIAEERDGAGILFAGNNPSIFRMDLRTGESRELIRVPEVMRIYGLKMSMDGKLLGSMGLVSNRHTSAAKAMFDVWSYDRLRGR
jgi:hypothetical protein